MPPTAARRDGSRIGSDGSEGRRVIPGSFHFPRSPYYPAKADWTEPGPRRGIVEIPVPRSSFLNLPFYNNFHLWSGSPYRRLSIALMGQIYVVYLFHLIEFVDLRDGIQEALRIHPHLATTVSRKIDVMKDTVSRLLRRYQVIRTDQFVQRHQPAFAGVGPR